MVFCGRGYEIMVGCAQSWDEPAFQEGPDGSFRVGFLTPHWDHFCCYCSEQSRLCFLRDCTCWAKVLLFYFFSPSRVSPTNYPPNKDRIPFLEHKGSLTTWCGLYPFEADATSLVPRANSAGIWGVVPLRWCQRRSGPGSPPARKANSQDRLCLIVPFQISLVFH